MFKGQKRGIGKEYNDEGQLIYEGEFLNGEKHGKGNYKEYFGNGNLKLEGILNNGEFDGIVHEYYDDGKLLFKGEYKNWSRCDGVIFDKNGEIIDELKEGQSLK